MQSRTASAIEATLNILTGFVISYLVWVFLVPVLWPEHASSYSTAFGITCLFTITSWLRSFLWRRWFNARLIRQLEENL